LALQIDGEDYSPAWEGITYQATYSGRRYFCVVAIHHLKMKIGKEALAEFRARLPDVERATEVALRAVQAQTDEGTRRPTERVIVPLDS
jgi:hypothetical protein